MSPMPRPTFKVDDGARGAVLRVTLPKGVVVHGLTDGFLAANKSVHSRKSTRKITKFAPLRDFWSSGDLDAELLLSAAMPCSIHLIEVKGRLRVRPSAIMACESTVVFTSTSWLSSAWVDVSGSGTLALHSAGHIVEVESSSGAAMQFACSRVLAHDCDTKKSVGGDSALWAPDVAAPSRTWLTTARHGLLVQQHLGRAAAAPKAAAVSIKAWWQTSLQIFIMGLLLLLVVIFSDSIEKGVRDVFSFDQDELARWINRMAAQYRY